MTLEDWSLQRCRTLNRSSIPWLNLLVKIKIFCNIELMNDNSFFRICRQLTGRLEEAPWSTQGKVSIFKVSLIKSHLINFYLFKYFYVL